MLDVDADPLIERYADQRQLLRVREIEHEWQQAGRGGQTRLAAGGHLDLDPVRRQAQVLPQNHPQGRVTDDKSPAIPLANEPRRPPLFFRRKALCQGNAGRRRLIEANPPQVKLSRQQRRNDNRRSFDGIGWQICSLRR